MNLLRRFHWTSKEIADSRNPIKNSKNQLSKMKEEDYNIGTIKSFPYFNYLCIGHKQFLHPLHTAIELGGKNGILTSVQTFRDSDDIGKRAGLGQELRVVHNKYL